MIFSDYSDKPSWRTKDSNHEVHSRHRKPIWMGNQQETSPKNYYCPYASWRLTRLLPLCQASSVCNFTFAHLAGKEIDWFMSCNTASLKTVGSKLKAAGQPAICPTTGKYKFQLAESRPSQPTRGCLSETQSIYIYIYMYV